MARPVMLGGKCGCPVCRDGSGQGNTPRNFWKSRQNKKGHGYGRTKPTGKARK